MILPQHWVVSTLNNCKIIYGLSSNLQSPAYTIYISDFRRVWVESLDHHQLIEKAKLLGVEDLRTKQLKEIISLIALKVCVAENMTFDINNSNLCALLDCVEFKWSFSLMSMKPSECIDFLASLNELQFTNHQVLLEKIHHLQRIIDVKDVYTKFLMENFKLSHGMDLITSYKRNNKSDLDAIEPFVKNKWLDHFDTSITKDIHSATNDLNTWKIASRICQETAPVAIKDPLPFESVQFYTSPLKEDTPKNPTKVETENDDNLANQETNEPNSSPIKKPKRFGALKSSRKLIEKPPQLTFENDDQIQTQSSPKKRTKKFGSLPVRKKKKKS